jgi:hypothetical protein
MRPAPKVATCVLRSLFAAAAVVGAIGVLGLAWLPLPTAWSHFAIEDMGYYLSTARNVVAGRGVTLDGTNPTNGFHPLWLVVIAMVEWLFGGNPQAVFHLTLTIAALCFVATGLLLCRQIREDAGAWLVAPFAGLFFLNYRLASVPLGGLESAMSGMMAVLAAALVSRWTDVLNVKRAILLGFVLGLAVLARMDNLLLGAVILSRLAWRSWRLRSWPLSRLVLCCAAASFAVLLPWFIFSWHAVHAWLPRSGEALLLWSPSPWARPWTAARLDSAFRTTVIGPAGNVANTFGLWPFVNTFGIIRRSGAIWFGVALLLLAFLSWRVRQHDRVAALSWIPVYALLHGIYYLQFGSEHLRYLYPVVLLLFFYFFVVIGAAVAPSRAHEWWVATVHETVAVMVIVAAFAGFQAYRLRVGTGYFHTMHGAFYEDLAPWLAQHSEPFAKVGAFNGGILSYFSGRTVVNLDGVMNDRAIAAIRNQRLCEYIDGQRIGYLADNEEAIEFFLSRDESCETSRWRTRWQVVHRVIWPPDATSTLMFVVIKRR